jgi:hypothetical protein
MGYIDSLVFETPTETPLDRSGPLRGSRLIAELFEWVSGVGFQVSDFWCEAIGSEYAAEGMRHFSILIKMADTAVSGLTDT